MSGLEFKIRRLTRQDAREVAQISQSAPEAGNWAPGNYERLAEMGLEGWAAIAVTAGQEKRIVAFLVARCVAPEVEILNVATEVRFRGAGAATALVTKCLESARRRGARNAFLEVRESNRGAIRLYERTGFRISGRRTRYYRDPDDDAVLMTCVLGEKN
jgi:ribosomal-protein-alanine N-acetyltransferase